ncbi:MAG TPA: tetratricopeptide repeat protein [Candidatus Eisenbacteria bacterium]|nr:tetratricopeptide repeat protein [Candidatus Eisenbacteria bacterium]
MNVRRAFPVILALLLLAPAVLAMSTEPREPAPTPSSTPGVPGSTSSQASGERNVRKEAEESYALAYEEVGKAKKDLEDGKTKNAEKKFKRALERSEQAVLLDPRYHEAWNLVGYTARKTGDYDKAFKAYDKCLAIKPDFAPAREYLGEAWLDKGDAKKAREQLVWLERLNAAEELKTLKARYDAWAVAHPDSAEVPASPAAAPDSTAAAGGTSGK